MFRALTTSIKSHCVQKVIQRRLLTTETTITKKPGIWKSAEWWGGAGAMAGWGMTGK